MSFPELPACAKCPGFHASANFASRRSAAAAQPIIRIAPKSSAVGNRCALKSARATTGVSSKTTHATPRIIL